MQNWLRIYHYPRDFLELTYRYYAAHGRAYICTYYRLDIPSSGLDLDMLDAGAYETTGDLSGLRWEKIAMLPIYNTEQIQPIFTADERGFGKFDQNSTFNIPSIYGIVPTAKDFVIFDETIVNQDGENATSPVYQVVNFEKATNVYITFWKMNIRESYHHKDEIEAQSREAFSFFDYGNTTSSAIDYNPSSHFH